VARHVGSGAREGPTAIPTLAFAATAEAADAARSVGTVSVPAAERAGCGAAELSHVPAVAAGAAPGVAGALGQCFARRRSTADSTGARAAQAAYGNAPRRAIDAAAKRARASATLAGRAGWLS